MCGMRQSVDVPVLTIHWLILLSLKVHNIAYTKVWSGSLELVRLPNNIVRALHTRSSVVTKMFIDFADEKLFITAVNHIDVHVQCMTEEHEK